MVTTRVMQHSAGDDVRRREQIARAVALEVVRHRPLTTGLDRQRRLRAIQHLKLDLFIERDNHNPLVRIERQPDDIDEHAIRSNSTRVSGGTFNPRSAPHHSRLDNLGDTPLDKPTPAREVLPH